MLTNGGQISPGATRVSLTLSLKSEAACLVHQRTTTSAPSDTRARTKIDDDIIRDVEKNEKKQNRNVESRKIYIRNGESEIQEKHKTKPKKNKQTSNNQNEQRDNAENRRTNGRDCRAMGNGGPAESVGFVTTAFSTQ